jgi:GNAT superfamily N-acetyltransferase
MHKLAVIEAFRGKGIAERMIDFAKDEVRLRGRRYLRLDCRTYRTGLVKYYLGKGFDLVIEREAHHGMASLFQWETPA